MLHEFNQYLKDLNQKEFYHWLKETGIGFTPLARLPKQINPFDDHISIFAKLEYTNFAESIKARAFATMYYLNKVSGRMNNKSKVIAATSGNFGLAGSYLLRDQFSFTVNMSEKGAKENVDLSTKLVENGAKIETFSDGYCPTVGAKRGEAIAAARFVEKIDSQVINYDQYDDWANPLSHYLTTGPEIYHQTNGKLTHFISSLGTCATMIGIGTFLKEVNPQLKLVGLFPQQDHHQLGLRSKEELGATRFFGEAQKLCDQLTEVSDKNAYNTMLKLWDLSIPAGISSGANIWGALDVAKELYESNKQGLIVTVIPDSCENYNSFFKTHFENVTGKKFQGGIYKKYEEAAIKAQQARKEHLAELKGGTNEVFNSLTNSGRT
jgi:cysteine synthase B